MYIAGASESLNDAKQNALNDAMRQAAEQAGVLVNSYSKTHNMELTDDEVTVVATKIIKIINKNFDVNLIADSEIKVIAHIDVVVNTESINEDILQLKKKNVKLEEEKNEIMKRQEVLAELHNLANEIRKMYKGEFDLYEKEKIRKNLTPSSYYVDALENFKIDMKKGDYNCAETDIAIASLNYKKMNKISKEERSFYIDDKICDFEIKRIEAYIANNEYPRATEECIYFANLIERNNYDKYVSDGTMQKTVKYFKILSEYIDMYEPDKWNIIMENPGFPRIG